MKSLALSLLATLVGLAMLVIGIAGVAGAFEKDEDSGSSSSSTEDVSDFASCETTDSRFDEFTTVELSGPGGTANVIVTCQARSVEISAIGTGVTAAQSRTVGLWLYNGREEAELVASSQQEGGEDALIISGPLPSGSEDYEKLVVTESPPSADFEDPTEVGRVIMQARL